MKLFICTDHDCHYPVGVASVVLAADEDQARALLDVELIAAGLKGSDREPYTLQEWDLRMERAAPEMKTILLFAVTDIADDGQVKNWRMGTGFKDRHNGWNWEGRIQKVYEIPPTHWMPLPEPPLAEGQPEGPHTPSSLPSRSASPLTEDK